MIGKSAQPPTLTPEDQALRPATDPAAFRQLFLAHAPFVWRVARRFGVADADLDDVCQEVFVVLHRRLHEHEGRSSVRTWLYEVARRTALAHRRTRARRPLLLEDTPEPDDPTLGPSEQLEQRQALRWLSHALAQLDDDKREAFVLYELEEMTLAEVAQALSVPLNTIHYRIHAARAVLRTLAEREAAPPAAGHARARLVSGRAR